MDPLVELSRERIARGSKSFAGAARLFDRETRASAYMLYAWCRHCDDEVDGQELGFNRPDADPAEAHARLERLFHETRSALEAKPSSPVFEALARVVARHDIPHQHPFELLEGFRMDVEGMRFVTLDDTLRYSYHVAGVVGVMMAMVMGVRTRATLSRASDLGIAFQLTNIARDVVADAQVGRVYLPAEWLADAGLPSSLEHDARMLADPVHRAVLFDVTARLLDTADDYYASAVHGIGDLPPRAAWAIASARNVYREIGQEIRRKRSAAWDTRAYIGRARKLSGVALGGVQAIVSRVSPVDRSAGSRKGLWTHPDLRVDDLGLD